VLVELRGPDGTLKTRREVDNLVVDAGESHIADQLAAAPSQPPMGYMALGTSAVAPTYSNATLVAEIDRNALQSRTVATNIVTYVGFWAAGDATNSNIQEAGIFNAVSSGTMLARTTFPVVDKLAADTLTVTWTVTVGTIGA
jgi:hypothetical protein